ncbi:hypothetical protein [Bradyrhizobium guangxiense]|uniref:hypothetical protein n=1 Tax=Bradyrhizobium guangxiense TaxID=1325115 RepID=UPI0010087A0E|nr:hypothetical protein [Bradyrhizobium guangxiense]
MKIVSTRASAGHTGWGLSAFVRPDRSPHLSYVNDAGFAIIEDAIGAGPPDRERRVDRRTACLHQADAFREKALADPEHHDQWIDEAIKWLERAMEASCRAAVTVEGGNPEPTGIIETVAPHQRLIARQ